MLVWVLLVAFVGATSSEEGFQMRVKYRYFDDYLKSMDRNERAFINGDKGELQMSEGSGEVDEPGHYMGSVFTRELPIRTGATRSKETTCCMLGQLAGDKGYHCFAKFYAARVLSRNYNRAHNKKIAGLRPRYASMPSGRDPVKDSSEKLMRTFAQCVTHRALVFHKCCHLTVMEQKKDDEADATTKFAERGRARKRLVSNRVR